jgi:hypothetical protein
LYFDCLCKNSSRAFLINKNKPVNYEAGFKPFRRLSFITQLIGPIYLIVKLTSIVVMTSTGTPFSKVG